MVPQRFSGGGGDGDVVCGKAVLRLVVVFLFALGKYLVCPLGVFSFRVGDCFAGRGSTAALLRLLGCGCAGSSSSRTWRVWLEASPPCSPPTRLPIFFQSFKSISVGALGWWFLRLHQDLESVGGRSGGFGFDCAPAARLVRSELSRKMNRASRALFVISFFFDVLFVSLGGCTVLQLF